MAKKIAKSETASMHYKKNEEIYQLDNMQVSFDTISKELKVSAGDKNILRLNCRYDSFDKNQQIRSQWFHMLLVDYARKRLAKEYKKQEKAEKLKNAQKAVNAANKLKHDEKLKEAATLDALKRIREL